MEKEVKTSYSKFMNDIIDLGIWKQLIPSAKALYIVLLKFSNGDLKHVWPSTTLLMELTGYKQKKSIIDAKKDLIKKGLIITKNGTGHNNTTYHFVYTYKDKGYKKIHPRDAKKYTPEMQKNTPQRCKGLNPNQNKNNLKKQNNSSLLTKLEKKDITVNIQDKIWDNFTFWSKDKLSCSSHKKLDEVEVRIQEKNVYLRKSSVSKNLESIIQKFFLQNEKFKIQFLDENEWKKKSSLL